MCRSESIWATCGRARRRLGLLNRSDGLWPCCCWAGGLSRAACGDWLCREDDDAGCAETLLALCANLDSRAASISGRADFADVGTVPDYGRRISGTGRVVSAVW